MEDWVEGWTVRLSLAGYWVDGWVYGMYDDDCCGVGWLFVTSLCSSALGTPLLVYYLRHFLVGSYGLYSDSTTTL